MQLLLLSTLVVATSAINGQFNITKLRSSNDLLTSDPNTPLGELGSKIIDIFFEYWDEADVKKEVRNLLANGNKCPKANQCANVVTSVTMDDSCVLPALINCSTTFFNDSSLPVFPPAATNGSLVERFYYFYIMAYDKVEKKRQNPGKYDAALWSQNFNVYTRTVIPGIFKDILLTNNSDQCAAYFENHMPESCRNDKSNEKFKSCTIVRIAHDELTDEAKSLGPNMDALQELSHTLIKGDLELVHNLTFYRKYAAELLLEVEGDYILYTAYHTRIQQARKRIGELRSIHGPCESVRCELHMRTREYILLLKGVSLEIVDKVMEAESSRCNIDAPQPSPPKPEPTPTSPGTTSGPEITSSPSDSTATSPTTGWSTTPPSVTSTWRTTTGYPTTTTPDDRTTGTSTTPQPSTTYETTTGTSTTPYPTTTTYETTTTFSTTVSTTTSARPTSTSTTPEPSTTTTPGSTTSDVTTSPSTTFVTSTSTSTVGSTPPKCVNHADELRSILQYAGISPKEKMERVEHILEKGTMEYFAFEQLVYLRPLYSDRLLYSYELKTVEEYNALMWRGLESACKGQLNCTSEEECFKDWVFNAGPVVLDWIQFIEIHFLCKDRKEQENNHILHRIYDIAMESGPFESRLDVMESLSNNLVKHVNFTQINTFLSLIGDFYPEVIVEFGAEGAQALLAHFKLVIAGSVRRQEERKIDDDHFNSEIVFITKLHKIRYMRALIIALMDQELGEEGMFPEILWSIGEVVHTLNYEQLENVLKVLGKVLLKCGVGRGGEPDPTTIWPVTETTPGNEETTTDDEPTTDYPTETSDDTEEPTSDPWITETSGEPEETTTEPWSAETSGEPKETTDYPWSTSGEPEETTSDDWFTQTSEWPKETTGYPWSSPEEPEETTTDLWTTTTYPSEVTTGSSASNEQVCSAAEKTLSNGGINANVTCPSRSTPLSVSVSINIRIENQGSCSKCVNVLRNSGIFEAVTCYVNNQLICGTVVDGVMSFTGWDLSGILGCVTTTKNEKRRRSGASGRTISSLETLDVKKKEKKKTFAQLYQEVKNIRSSLL